MFALSKSKLMLLGLFALFIFDIGIARAELKVIQKRGSGKVRLYQYENGQWQMLVSGRPYFIKGVVYEPVKVGQRLTQSNMWMSYDYNGNGKNDTVYESWVDKNSNNRRDKNEAVIGDWRLLKEMGCNTIRIYHPTGINKEILRDLYRRAGISVMMGNFLGAYTWGSGASWEKGTDYTDPKQRKNMLDDVRKMVVEFKDEPYILFWLLGNENEVAGFAGNSTLNNTNARLVPDVYTDFVNEAAKLIHELDPDHPVGISNATMRLMKYYAQNSPEVDIVGFNAYTGPWGFGTLWKAAKIDFDRPVVITEYGADCFDQNKKVMDEDFQALYHKRSWLNMADNSFNHDGVGNSIGGFAYIWLDSWWLCGKIDEHDVEEGAWRGPTKDSWMNDEWLGICGQGDGSQSPFIRQPRKVYYTYKQLWRNK